MTRRRVGRPTGQFNAHKDKLLFLLAFAPDYRTKNNQELGKIIGVGEDQIRRYINALKRENKIKIELTVSAWPSNGRQNFYSRRKIEVLEDDNAIL